MAVNYFNGLHAIYISLSKVSGKSEIQYELLSNSPDKRLKQLPYRRHRLYIFVVGGHAAAVSVFTWRC